MEKPLQDKTALVTGGAQGLGAALCERLAREGAHVVAAALAAQTGRHTLAVKSDQAGYMTGQAINVTGGQEMR